MIQQVCVGGFIQNKNGEFLVVKRSDTDEFFPSMWELPGGGIEVTETPQEGLIREVSEEVELDITVGKPLGVHTYFMNQDQEVIHRVEITFLCKQEKEKPVVLSGEHAAYQWILSDAASEFAFSDYMKQVIIDCLKVV